MGQQPVPELGPAKETGIRATSEPAFVDWMFILVLGAPTVFGGVCLAVSAFSMFSMDGPYDEREELQFTQEARRASEHDPEGARYLSSRPIVKSTRRSHAGRVEALLGPMEAPTRCHGEVGARIRARAHAISVDNIWLTSFDASDRVEATSADRAFPGSDASSISNLSCR
jgi:hypothetical protein